MEGDVLSHVLIGGIFCLFGLKWACEYSHFWINPRRYDENGSLSTTQKLATKCEKLCTNHPVEGSLKLTATAIGLIGTIVADLPDNLMVSPKVVHATIYLFFALSGLVDVLTFYFPRNVTKGLASLALAQSFFAEGFLFMWALPDNNMIINNILGAIVWITVLTIGAELIWPDLKLLRAFMTLLHGGWMAHMVRVFHIDALSSSKVALAFSWHIAAAFGITIIVVVVVKSCSPKVRCVDEQPPEIPIYDYCNEPHNI